MRLSNHYPRPCTVNWMKRRDPPASPRSLPEKFDHARRRRFGATTHNQCVEIRIVERLCSDTDTYRGAHGPVNLGQQPHVKDWLTRLPIRIFEC
jgi:hypothetical protein